MSDSNHHPHGVVKNPTARRRSCRSTGSSWWVIFPSKNSLILKQNYFSRPVNGQYSQGVGHLYRHRADSDQGHHGVVQRHGGYDAAWRHLLSHLLPIVRAVERSGAAQERRLWRGRLLVLVPVGLRCWQHGRLLRQPVRRCQNAAAAAQEGWGRGFLQRHCRRSRVSGSFFL